MGVWRKKLHQQNRDREAAMRDYKPPAVDAFQAVEDRKERVAAGATCEVERIAALSERVGRLIREPPLYP